jgi:hypothetical protein
MQQESSSAGTPATISRAVAIRMVDEAISA